MAPQQSWASHAALQKVIMLPDTYSTGKPLKFHLESATALNMFTGYGDGYVMVNGQRVERSVVVLPDRILPDWPATTFEELAAEHFSVLADLGLEIVLLGTGKRLRFPPPEVLRPLIRTGLGVEVMDIQAACRTYNILVAEARKVAAALLFE
jgi:uncharacterized protein